MKNSTQRCQGTRRGFTLLELLIVVAVIATLVTISVVVMAGIADDAQETATVTTIQKLNRLIDQRLEAFDRGFPAVSDSWEDNFRTYVAIELESREGVPRDRAQRLLTAFTSDLPVWEILARKAAYRSEFPQRFFDVDLVSDADRATLPDNQKWPARIRNRYLTEVAQLRWSQDNGGATPDATQLATELDTMWQNHAANPETESAELLYFMLFHSGSYGASAVGEDDFDVAEIADTDNDGMPEFVDSWGNPLRFYRWPTRLIDPFLPLTAFQPPNLPDRADQDEMTDLQMIVGVDGTWTTVAAANGRTVTVGEREVADYLIKGLPRRLEFTPAYLSAIAASYTDRPGISDVNVIVPPDPLLRDPDDPAGLLYALLEDGLPIAGTTIDLSWEFNEAKYHTPDTFHAPLIVSPGLDGELGLFEPQDTANLGHLAMYDISLTVEELVDTLGDNLSNRNRRAGGQR